MEPEPKEQTTAQDRQDINPFEEYLGALPAFSNVDEIKAWVREMRGEDAEEGPEGGPVPPVHNR